MPELYLIHVVSVYSVPESSNFRLGAKMSNPGIQQFKINIPPQEVDRLQRKLNDTRLPPREIVPGAGTNYGIRYLLFLPIRY